MNGAEILGVLFLAWQAVGTFFPEVSGGKISFLFGCLGVFLAYKFLSQSPGPSAGSDTERDARRDRGDLSVWAPCGNTGCLYDGAFPAHRRLSGASYPARQPMATQDQDSVFDSPVVRERAAYYVTGLHRAALWIIIVESVVLGVIALAAAIFDWGLETIFGTLVVSVWAVSAFVSQVLSFGARTFVKKTHVPIDQF